MSELNRSASRRDILKTERVTGRRPDLVAGSARGKGHQSRPGRLRWTRNRRGGAGAESGRLLRADRSGRHLSGAHRRQPRPPADASAKDKVKVEKTKMFVGLDAYQKLIDSGVDVVLLATPPGFRPQHLRAAIEANKHVFCEKPIAVDAPGVRHVMETAKMAKEKNLSLVAGLLLAVQQLHPGRFRPDSQWSDRRHRRLLRHLLHQPREADAAGEHAAGRHERCRMADPQLVQLRLDLRRRPGGAGDSHRR